MPWRWRDVSACPMEPLTNRADVSPATRKVLPGEALPCAPASYDELVSAGPYRPRQAEPLLGDVTEDRFLPHQGVQRHVQRLEDQFPSTPCHPLTAVQRLKEPRVDTESGKNRGRRSCRHLGYHRGPAGKSWRLLRLPVSLIGAQTR